MKIGIDTLAFYSPNYFLDLRVLAKARGIDPEKFTVGLGQDKMAIPAPDEDIVTMAANAAAQALKDISLNDIDTIFFATESGIDQSKAAGTYIHKLLNFPKNCRVIEFKQACYAGTCALQMAVAWVMRNPKKKVLVLASDVARYGLGTAGESSQGAGACAMVISAAPRILAIEPGSGLFTEEVMDFWRPNYREEALVDGKYSSLIYLRALEHTWNDFTAKTNRDYNSIDYYLFHTPIPRLVEKAYKHLAKKNGVRDLSEDGIKAATETALYYPRQVGNTYTAALYISLASLLDSESEDLSGKRIGFYSYGSGCVAEYFSGIVQKGYKNSLNSTYHHNLLVTRTELPNAEYEKLYQFNLPVDGSELITSKNKTGNFRLAGIKNHKRQYQAEEKFSPVLFPEAAKNAINAEETVTAISPGKIILTGEHSVVYGNPAIAIAVNRYATTTVTPQLSKMISFNLFSSKYRDSYPIETLREIKNRLTEKYQLFLKGDLGIREVLKTPLELAGFTFSNLFEHLNAKFANGFDIQTQSTIPLGCGMGSSAAVILSVLRAIAAHFGMSLTPEKYYQLGMDAEKLQHGHPSGLDIQASLRGGCVRFEDGEIEIMQSPDFPMYVVNSGAPNSTTGECVEFVKSKFANTEIWQDFKNVTLEFDKAIRANQNNAIAAIMRENHRLLSDIGVVPEKVQNFVSEVEAANGAAKICGAGAIKGNNAGIVLVTAEDKNRIETISKKYQYQLLPISIAEQGLHLA